VAIGAALAPHVQPPAHARAGAPTAAAPPGRGALVWADASGEGRAQVVLFRYDLTVTKPPAHADLQLFADSQYLLYVGGHAVAAGPARFYPAHPEHDTIDIAPYLRAGKNVIGVKVMSSGTDSYQQQRQPGAFVAWGTVDTGGGVRADLATPGRWRCARDAGYDAGAARMSFATGPIEIDDARRGRADFLDPGAALSDWQAPTPLARPDRWGPLRPRSIPLLTEDELTPRALLGAYALDDSEEVVSFSEKLPDATADDYQATSTMLAYTFIHSPREQDVDVGLWWGDHYLDGAGPLKPDDPAPPRRNRHRFHLHLKAGWSYYFVRHGALWGTWDFYVAAPKTAGLAFSPDKDLHGPASFMVAGPFTRAEEKQLAALRMPLAPADLPASLSSRWRAIARARRATNPAVDVAWRGVGARLNLDPARTADIDVAAATDAALVFDLGATQLGRLFVDYDGPPGTTVDAAWAEALDGPLPAVLAQPGLYTAARHVSAGGPSRLETVKPYGARFLQINVSGHAGGAVHVRRLGVVRRVYPFAQVGSFACSDPTLTALWELGWRTLQVCAEDSYIDSPFRERGLYAGDMLPETAITLAASGDLRLLKRSLRLFQDMYRDLLTEGAGRGGAPAEPPGDFPLITLDIWKWYVDRTGDLAFARELFPGYARLVDAALARRAADGLVEAPRTLFVEWSALDKDHVESTAYAALLARAARDLAGIAARLGDGAQARRYAGDADAVAAAMNRQLWDDARGAFADGLKGGRPIGAHLPISSAWPSLWGLTSPAQEERLADFWRGDLARLHAGDDGGRVTPYGGFFVLGALYRNGHARLAEDFMRRHWGPMLEAPSGTAWENFTTPRTGGTRSHAWSGGPTFWLSTQVLGVDLGYASAGAADIDDVLIAPQADTVSWARGTVPHPRGPIAVDWRVDGDLLRMTVRAPPSVRYHVAPRGRLGTLRLELNGRLVR
jgi:hypothetical protein